MIELRVEGMTCGHCAQAVATAVRTAAPASAVTVDRNAGRVVVEGDAERARVVQAIAKAGYTVTAND